MKHTASHPVSYALAGLQAGISGALGLLVWMSLAARFFGKSVWWPMNVLASVFYGGFSLRTNAGRYTFTGAALVFFVYGLVGVGFGLLWRERKAGLGLLSASLLTGIVAYYFLFKTAWQHYSPEGALYAANRQVFCGHLIYALLLARLTKFVPSVKPVDTSADPALAGPLV